MIKWSKIFFLKRVGFRNYVVDECAGLVHCHRVFTQLQFTNISINITTLCNCKCCKK
jgi:hypothetical protein